VQDNPVTGEAAQSIVSTLQQNDVLLLLWLPKYSTEISKTLVFLEDVINKNRKSHKCRAKLEIKFPR